MRPILRLLVLVGVHKLLLLLTLFSSTFTWDTSSLLVLKSSSGSALLKMLASRVMVWDSVYYTAIAFRGLQHEHEYAFFRYWDWAALVRALSPDHSLPILALTAAALSLLSHALAVVLLYKLSSRWMSPDSSFKVAWLYILSPAGIFLVAGYPESLFAALSFGGLLMSSRGSYVIAGMCFAMATLLRANGLLWGLVFLVALCKEVFGHKLRLRVLTGIIVGGLAVGAAFIVPQAKAHISWCPGREWCNNRVPAIYSYVQAHYWGVGLFHYWTLGNIPNFFLGMPTLILLLFSSRLLWHRRLYGILAVQLALTTGALCFWHVQTVTRIASCVPGPYWYITELLESTDLRRKRQGKFWTAYFVVWGVTQTALFGAFLPPA